MTISEQMTRSELHGTRPLPSSLGQWRERALDGVLRTTFIVWAVTLMIGIYNVIQSNLLQENPLQAFILVIAYVAAASIMGAITFRRKFSFNIRSGAILVTLYLLGITGLLRTGLDGDGRIFLFTFVVVTAIFYDHIRSSWALIVSVITLVAAAWLPISGLWNAIFSFPPHIEPTVAWLNAGLVFVALSVAMILSVSYLIRSLDRSLAEASQERNFVSTILETSGALVVLFDPEGRIVRFNRACEHLTGFSFEEVYNQYVWDILLTPGGVDLLKVVFQRVKEEKQPSNYESYWLTKDGSRHLIAWSTSALRDHQGEIEFIVSSGIDITVNQQAEAERERLLTAEHEQRLLAETLAEITLALTSQTSPTAVLDEILHRVQRVVPFKTANIALLDNDTLQIAKWQGYDIFGGDEVVNNLVQPLSAFLIEADVVKTRQPYVIHNTRQETRWVSIEKMEWIRSHLIVPIVLQDRVLGLLRLDGNIPGEFSNEDARRLQPLANAAAIALENARLHQETLRQAQRVQQILDTTGEGIVLLNANNIVELVNPAAEEYLKSLAGVGVGDQLTGIRGESLSRLLESPPDSALAHELTMPKEGRIFEAAAHPLAGNMETGGSVLILREVTESRKQQQYVQAQERLAMVGQLAAGIAHDFNNIMTVIILYAQMLLKLPDFATGEDQRMGIIFKQAKLAANLIAQILDFSRQSSMERRPVNLVFFLKELLKMLKRTLPETINLELIYDEGEFGVSADLTRLQQVVMNLAVNARDAMPDGGNLTMSIDRLELESGERPPLPDMGAGDWITLEVADSGVGINPEDLPHVFEPFFTTKEAGQGTGLGLAQVYGIVKQHGGFIGLDSAEGEGSTFKIYLPAIALAEVLMPVQPEVGLSEGGGETLLVVEDDENMLEAVCEILKTLNYRALAASNGEQALELFRQHQGEIALVISDMVMPIMSGSKLYTKLQEIEPEIKMVIITGYPFDEQDRALLSQGIVAWIQKPFVLEQIAVAIRQALVS